jgi:predicted PurR-regulated permease PerM
MQFSRHIDITGGALRRWFVAQCYDSLAVGALWWFGLDYLHVPWAPFWAILAAGLQFIPHFGPVLALMGPALVALFAGGFEQFLYVLILYGVIIVIDGLVLQPVIMRRTARVPIWASLIVPILLTLMFGLWGLLLAAPLLAVIFAYRAHRAHGKQAESLLPRQTPPGQEITGGRLISPDTPTGHIPHHDETL